MCAIPAKALEKKVRVLIADDQAPIRKAVRWVLEEDPRFEVCGEAVDGARG
jgi:chemotaxis response regulator CheB